jgi:hypothetical protein
VSRLLLQHSKYVTRACTTAMLEALVGKVNDHGRSTVVIIKGNRKSLLKSKVACHRSAIWAGAMAQHSLKVRILMDYSKRLDNEGLHVGI